MRPGLRAVVALSFFAVSTLVTNAPALAEELWRVEGTVSDLAGRPIQGARVRLEWEGSSSYTDSNGFYSLAKTEYVPEGDRVIVTKDGFNLQWRSITIADSLEPVNFQLVHSLWARVTPFVFESAPHQVSVTAFGRFDIQTTCVVAEAKDLDLEVSLLYSLADQNWTGAFEFPEGQQTGFYPIEVRATDCGTGTTISQVDTRVVVFDQAPPQVQITAPTSGHAYAGLLDAGPSIDGKTRSLGRLSVKTLAQDDALIERVRIEVRNPYGDYVDSCGWYALYLEDATRNYELTCHFTLQGRYSVRAVVRDFNGYETWTQPLEVTVNGA